ncbi:MAG: hypothetical protein HYX72_05945 [Acidobacteria bacterium]|nr:hypothetical protein [Acidobacteriota bacterium]
MNILETLLDRGFAFRPFPAYPRHLGVEKYHCAALLELTPEGKLKLFSSAGYLLDSGEIALLIERQDKSVFVHKSKEVPAEGEVLDRYQRFLRELQSALDKQ